MDKCKYIRRETLVEKEIGCPYEEVFNPLQLIHRELALFEIEKIEVDGKTFHGMKSTLPDVPPLVLIKGSKGFIMCGYLNIEAAERLGAAAAMVSGVKSFDDVLNAQIKSATTKGKHLGLEPGKIVRDVIAAIA